jgi:hypothetical protein
MVMRVSMRTINPELGVKFAVEFQSATAIFG